MPTYDLTDASDKEYVEMCEKQHDPAPFADQAANFEKLRDASQVEADEKEEAKQLSLKSFLTDKAQDVPPDTLITVNDSDLGVPQSLSW